MVTAYSPGSPLHDGFGAACLVRRTVGDRALSILIGAIFPGMAESVVDSSKPRHVVCHCLDRFVPTCLF